MNKILIEVICAATATSYDFWIPKNIPVSRMLDRLIADISEYEENDDLFPNTFNTHCYHPGQGVFLNKDQTVVEAGLKGGDRILIV